MSCCGGKDEASLRSKEIEEGIRKDKKDAAREAKLLLLGAGESGKSTVAKQMKIIYLKGFSDEEKSYYKDHVHSNILDAARVLVNAAKRFQYTFEAENQILVDLLSDDNDFMLTPSSATDLKTLWNDKAIQDSLERKNEFQLIDSTEYFFDELDRIGSADYVPTEQDILRVRAKTTGIIETDFHVDGIKLRMVDVGGQRSERKKWIHCFQDVTAVLFIVALSEYDLKLAEDESVNRMDESLKLFDEVCNCKWFVGSSLILFLNKSDLFAEKIKKRDLSCVFPTYKGGKNFDKSIAYVTKKFEGLNKTEEKDIYTHVTTATDTKNVEFVFNAVKATIFKGILKNVGGL